MFVVPLFGCYFSFDLIEFFLFLSDAFLKFILVGLYLFGLNLQLFLFLLFQVLLVRVFFRFVEHVAGRVGVAKILLKLVIGDVIVGLVLHCRFFLLKRWLHSHFRHIRACLVLLVLLRNHTQLVGLVAH